MANVISINAIQHNVKSVTIFSSHKAEVVRDFEVNLQKGENEVKIVSLSSSIDTESARITGLEDASATVFDLVCSIKNDEPMGLDKRSDALKAHERRLTLLQAKKHALGQQGDMLNRFGFSLNAENNTIDYAAAFYEDYGKRTDKLLADIAEVEIQIETINDQIAEEIHKEEQKRKRSPTFGLITAIIMSKRAGKAEIRLTYMVNGASWRPSYDLRASTEGGKPPKTVTLHYRAAILQDTGEDWANTNLSLSTADPGSVTTAPYLRPLRIVPKPMVLARQGNGNNNINVNVFAQNTNRERHLPPASSGGLFGGSSRPTTSLFGSASSSAPTGSSGFSFGAQSATPAFGASSAPSAFGTTATLPDNPPVPLQAGAVPELVETASEVSGDSTVKIWDGKSTTVSESAVSSSFRIDGTCSIPSDNCEHKVVIAVIPFEAEVYYSSVPRMKPIAFLQCTVTNTSEYRLLPGPVTVYLDDSPVSKSHIFDVNPEEKFSCTLGPDPLIRVRFTRLPQSVSTMGSAFAAQTTCTTCKTVLRVQNNHTFAIKGLICHDTIPAPMASDNGQHGHAESQNIKVVLKEPAGLSEAVGVGYVDVKDMIDKKNSKAKVRWHLLSGDRDGKYEWNVDIGAGEEVSLTTEYDVRTPSDYQWVLQDEGSISK